MPGMHYPRFAASAVTDKNDDFWIIGGAKVRIQLCFRPFKRYFSTIGKPQDISTFWGKIDKKN